jgi:phosphoglycolate phosphatase-like HAD superfamily hydrolase
MLTLVALYGYIGEQEDPHGWGADGVLNDISELPGWLRAESRVREAR